MRYYYVYVIELEAIEVDKRDRRRSRDVYVGSSALPPQERFQKHKYSPKGSRHVRKRGVRLRPDLYRGVNPMRSREIAKREEQKLAHQLSRQGYRVYGSCSPRKEKDCWL